MTEIKETIKLVGLRLKSKTTNHNNKSGKDCGDLWQQFERDKIFEFIPGKTSNEVYAVYFDYDNEEEKTDFSYFIGCNVAKGTETPNELDELIIPAQKYSKHTAKGVMTGCITDTWKEIWNSDLNRKFGYDFEVYDERSQDWSNAEVDIFVSVT